MSNILDLGVDMILGLQSSMSPTFDPLFKFFTYMGDEPFDLVALPLIYWCLNRELGMKLTILFVFSAFINGSAKVLVDQPRPFQYDPRVQAIVHASGGGFPSGHTQNTMVFWGLLASTINRPVLWGLALALMILTPLSRLYLGVHFPTDLLGGYIIGGFILIGFMFLEPRIAPWLAEKGFGVQLVLAAIASLVLVALAPAENDAAVSAAGTIFGASIGLVLERRWVRFLVDGRPVVRVLRFFTGLVLIAAVYIGLKLAFGALEPAWAFRTSRYFMVGLTACFIAPLVFTKIGLARTEQNGS